MCHFSLEIDLDLMTLIFKLDLNMIKMHLYAESEVPRYSGSKVIAVQKL